MAKKPPNLIYSVDENPPTWTTVLLSLQHIFALSTVLIPLLPEGEGGVRVREQQGKGLRVRSCPTLR
jgi:xanthine/uracil permease